MAGHQEEDDLLVAFLAGLRPGSPEADESEPPEDAGSPELMAAAADGGVDVIRSAAAASGSAAEEVVAVPDGRADAVVDLKSSREGGRMDEESVAGAASAGPRMEVAGALDPKVPIGSEIGEVDAGKELCLDDANRLFSMLFGEDVSKEILLRRTNQGIRLQLSRPTFWNLELN